MVSLKLFNDRHVVSITVKDGEIINGPEIYSSLFGENFVAITWPYESIIRIETISQDIYEQLDECLRGLEHIFSYPVSKYEEFLKILIDWISINSIKSIPYINRSSFDEQEAEACIDRINTWINSNYVFYEDWVNSCTLHES